MANAEIWIMPIGELRRSCQSLLDEIDQLTSKNRQLSKRTGELARRVERTEREWTSFEADRRATAEQQRNVERSREHIESIVTARAAVLTSEISGQNRVLSEQVHQQAVSIDNMRASYESKIESLREDLGTARERARQYRAELLAERKRTREENVRRMRGEAKRTLEKATRWASHDLSDVALVAGAQTVLATKIVRAALRRSPESGEDFLAGLRSEVSRRRRAGQSLEACQSAQSDSWAQPRPDRSGPIGPGGSARPRSPQ